MNQTQRRKGFTLIELLVVIAVIGILSIIILSSLNSSRTKARDAQRVSDIRQIRLALNLFYDDYGHYPCGNPLSNTALAWSGYITSDSTFDKPWDSLKTLIAPYIKALPVDPVNTRNGSSNVQSDSNYVYVYYTDYPCDDYDLTAQFEDHNNKYRNQLVHYVTHIGSGGSPAFWSRYLFGDH
jgi:prepilin-type N-terminal cleavage/methylation domain-containing protein